MSSPQAVVAFAFGFRRNDPVREPGISNQQLAALARCTHPLLPLFAETEVFSALRDLDRTVECIPAARRRAWTGTRAVAHGAADLCQARGIRRIAVIAHPAHRSRAEMDCRREGLVVVPGAAAPIDYDPASSQWWTRRRELWWIREAPLRLILAGGDRLRRPRAG
jgi:hypothetical protein